MKKFTVNEHEEKAIYHQALSSNAEKVNSWLAIHLGSKVDIYKDNEQVDDLFNWLIWDTFIKEIRTSLIQGFSEPEKDYFLSASISYREQR